MRVVSNEAGDCVVIILPDNSSFLCRKIKAGRAPLKSADDDARRDEAPALQESPQ